MSTHVNVHGVQPGDVTRYSDTHTWLSFPGEHGNNVTFHFDNLDAAESWLLDALHRVQLAKAESANTQPAPVHAERESNEVHGCYADDPTDGFICTLPRGHDGDHQAHGPRTTDEFDGELLASWPRVEFVAVPL